jgi:hypothetical protein
MLDSTIWILIASVFAPTALAVGSLWAYRKWQDRDGRTLPIVGKRITGAGELLRKRIDDDTDKMFMGLTTLFFIGPYFIAAWALKQTGWSQLKFSPNDWILIAGFVLMFAWSLRVIIRHGGARRRSIAGLKAELFTAQELNRLIGEGCTVLHDVPGEGFNLDHVVIGAQAVYLVETKSVRKPRKNDTGDHFKVAYDGDLLRFPGATTRKPLEQARRQAQWLASYLKQTLGQSVAVIPTVALPGWWIESPGMAGNDGVRVFNPAGRGAAFMSQTRGVGSLDRPTVGLITQALVMRYPVTD